MLSVKMANCAFFVDKLRIRDPQVINVIRVSAIADKADPWPALWREGGGFILASTVAVPDNEHP